MRMFVALWPDDRTREQLVALGLGGGHGVRWVAPDRWHVTLRFLGDVGPDLVVPLTDALRTGLGHLGPVRCRIGPSTAWLGTGRVLYVPVAGAEAAAAAAREATMGLAVEPARGDQPFTGHLTLGRVSGRSLGGPARAALAGVPVSGAFEAAHVDLVGSERSYNGHRYTVLGRTALTG